MHKYFFLYTCLLLCKRGQLTRSWLMTRPSSEHSTPNQEKGPILPSSQFLRAPYGSESTASLNFNRAAPAIHSAKNPQMRVIKQRLGKTKDPPKQEIQTTQYLHDWEMRTAETPSRTRTRNTPPGLSSGKSPCLRATSQEHNPKEAQKTRWFSSKGRVGPPRIGAEDPILPPALRWIQQEQAA